MEDQVVLEQESGVGVGPEPGVAGSGVQADQGQGQGQAQAEAQPRPQEFDYSEVEALVKQGGILPAGEVVGLLRKHGIRPEAAKELSGVFDRFVEGLVRKQEEQTGRWFEELQRDPEVGGPKLEENVKTVIRPVIQRYGSQQLVEVLDQSGLINHPEVVRFLYRVGKAHAEGSVVRAEVSSVSAKPRTTAEIAELLYPTMRGGQ